MIQENPLIYGSVIKIKTTNGKYDGILFFIHYIDNTKIELLSNNNLEKLILNRTSEGALEDIEIEELQTIYIPNGGYIKQHGIKKDDSIEIFFKTPLDDNRVSISGVVKDIQEDMMIVAITNDDDSIQDVYIDFHYSGLSPEYNIERIVHNKREVKQDSGFFIDLKSEDVEKIRQIQETKRNETKTFETLGEEVLEDSNEQYIQVYSIEQQVDDYIDKNFSKKINKKKVLFDIRRYKELLDKYVDLPNGIYAKSFTKDSMSNFFSKLSAQYIYPSTSYAHKEVFTFYDNEISVDLFDMFDMVDNTITDDNTFPLLVRNTQVANDDRDNLQHKKQKKESFHKYIRLPQTNKVYFMNEKPLNYLHSYGMKNGIFEPIKSYHTRIDNGTKMVIDGFVMPTKNEIANSMNLQSYTPLMNRSLQNLFPRLEKNQYNVVKKEKFDEKCGLFSDKHQYIPLQQNDVKLQNYFSRLGLNRKMIYDCFDENLIGYTSKYGLLNFLHNFGINEYDNNVIHELQRIVGKNTSNLKKNYINVKRAASSKKLHSFNYKIMHKDEVPLKLDNIYNINNIHLRSSSELLQHTMPDNHTLYSYMTSKIDNKLNMFDRVNEELPFIISELDKSLESYLMNAEENGKNSVDVEKTYNTISEMMNDENKIILMDFDQSNVYETMYGQIVKNNDYNEDINTFVAKIRRIQDSNDLNSEEHKSLFPNESILQNILTLMIDFKLQDTDKVLVKDGNRVFVYINGSFVDEKEHNENIRKKRVLKIRNKDLDFTEIKQTMVNDFVLEMINKIKKQQNKQLQREKLDYNQMVEYLKQKNNRIRSERFLRHTKYDREKNRIANAFYMSGHLSNIEESPYKDLFLHLLSLEDSDEKYEFIEKFAQKFTIDLNDESWLYCIKTNVKLLPKYLLRLSNAFLVSKNFSVVLDKICHNEGTLNDSADAWIHRASGYLLKRIEFDDADIYDRNSMLNLGKGLIEMEDDDEELMEDLEEMEDVDTVATRGMINTLINKRYVLSDEEKQIEHFLLSLTNMIGVKIDDHKSRIELIKEINNIYKNSIYKTKTDPIVSLTLSILSSLLIYIQCFGITTKKSFPGCINSFSGYPLDMNVGENEGMIYISCILHSISKNNPNIPYVKFSKDTKQDIFDKLMEYTQTHVISNHYIHNLISMARSNKLRTGIIHEKEYRIPTQFKPSLKTITTDEKTEFKDYKNSYEQFSSNQSYRTYLSKRFEQNVQEILDKSRPLLMTKYSQPFLINFCCHGSTRNENNFMDYLSKNSESKQNEIKSTLKEIYVNSVRSQILYEKNIRTPSICIPSQEVRKSLSEKPSSILSENTIFQFFINTFNFDNNKPIPDILSDMRIEKPSALYYNKKDDLTTKIKKLKENGYNFTEKTMVNAQDIINRVNYIKTKKQNAMRIQENKVLVSEKSLLYKEFSDFVSNNDINEVYKYLENGIRNNVDNYNSFLQRFRDNRVIRACKKVLRKINSKDVLDDHQTSNMISLYKHINFLLVSVLPQVVLNQNKVNDIIPKHWNLADRHENIIETNVEKYMKLMYNTNIPINTQNVDDEEVSYSEKKESYIRFFNDINVYSDLVFFDKLNEDKTLTLLLQKYITVKVMNVYSLQGDNVPEEYMHIDDKFTIEMNKKVISYIEYILHKTKTDYTMIKKKVYNTKQAEKKLTTDYFKNMKRMQRMAEKTKMNLKLGKWSFALNKDRVYKYSKKYFDEDLDESIKVQGMVDDEYSTNIEQLDLFGVEGTEEENMTNDIYNEESEPLNQIPEEEFYDDESNYNY